MRTRKTNIKKLIAGNGKAAVLDKPSDLTHLLYMAAKGNNGIRNVAIIWTLYGSGLRVGEVAQIEIRDVLTASGNLKRTFQLPGKITKTSKARTAYIFNKEHRKALNTWLKYRKENKGMLGDDPESWGGFNPDSPVFIVYRNGWRKFAMNAKKYKSGDGYKETLVCASLENLVRQLHKDSGFNQSSSHSGRRTLATWMERKGFDLRVIQNVLGHESADMTTEYIDPDLEKTREALNTFWGSVKL